jgi:two-component system chemotaxis response regulator CheV
MQLDKRKVLLESGTNELEIVEFCIDDGDLPIYCAVNVAKVREVIKKPVLSPIIGAPTSVTGMMTLRDRVLPAINLNFLLTHPPTKEAQSIIVLEFNKVEIAVLVNSVSRIFRLSWDQIEPPHAISNDSYITGLVKMKDPVTLEERIVQMLDFEKILAKLYQSGAIMAPDHHELLEYSGIGKKILVVDDSNFIREEICKSLRGAGYTVLEGANGEEAWSIITESLASEEADAKIDAVITDVEMPVMDGLHLVTLIRGKNALAKMPVYVFSSLASEDNIKKWKNLAINGVLSKPDLPKLVNILGHCLATQH